MPRPSPGQILLDKRALVALAAGIVTALATGIWWLLAPALLIAGALQRFTAFTATRSDSMLVIAAAGVVYGSIALLGATRMNLWSIRKHLDSAPLQGAEVD